MKILISGAAGKIGLKLCHELMASEHEVFGITSKPESYIPNKNIIHFDWLKPDIIDLPNVDIFIHLAGITDPYYLRNNTIEGIQSNILSFVCILESLKKVKSVPRLILLGTATEYGSKLNLIDENSKSESETFYEVLKESTFEIAKQYKKEKFLTEIINLRISNIYGFTNFNKNNSRSFIDKAIVSVYNNENVTIYGDGAYLRDYLHISDLINLLVKIIEKPIGDEIKVYNIGSYQSITLIEAVNTIIRETKKIKQVDSKIEYVEKQKNLYDLEWRNHSIQNSKIIADYEWEPTIKFEEGIRKTLNNLEILQNE